MSGGTLRYQGAKMESLWSDLSAVKHEFDNADQHSGDAADAVGHPELARRIRSFSSGWDSHRRELSESIEKLAKMALNIDNAFDDSETELVKSIAGEQ
ncbi:hypothetical protein ACQXVK_06060 [Curtobacterium sp. AB451]|uniref:hypothetical protein n=1 Tax=unclassified Curtobacterium TaxID=257496 RepID=UPI0011D1FD95|nr:MULTISPECIES: hypothetical protein [unclassified Curtobacterium]MDP4333475.1 hypothetical protein [Curtobacterium sp. A7_M15]